MKFYNRESELQLLEDIYVKSSFNAQLTLITGRRRVGKTALIKRFITNKKSLYFFISRKSEKLLCQEFVIQIEESLGIPVFGEISSFAKVFEMLMHISKENSITLVLDEFQEFMNINPSIFSEMQNIWDRYKDDSQINLIICGSVISLMKKIFEDSKEPLFGRATNSLIIKPFNINALKNILNDNYNHFSNYDLLAFFILTNGTAKYVEYFIDNKLFTLQDMLNSILKDNSLLLNEGKYGLIEEFGKEYTIYFSVLSLIASGKTSRSEIESVLQKNTGGYLDKLENKYMIIKRNRPILSKPNSRKVKYEISDNFLNFWFRFIYKNNSAVEIGNYQYVKKIIERDFDRFSGKFLEKYFIQKLSLEGNYSKIGNYRESKNQNEIDIVAINEYEKKALIAEVKLSRSKINLNILKGKSRNLIEKLHGYKFEYKGFSLEDM